MTAASDASIWREYGDPLLPPLAAGPLDGLTVAVKDLFPVSGFRVGAGNPAWLAGATPEPADAWAVHALRQAGAAIAGIAQTDELAFSLSGTNPHYGTPPNPAAPDLVTAGSSSGPAAAVATGQADIGLGTDTAGSIRVPASVCGLYGLRPTHGAVPDADALHLAPSFDTVGWMTATAPLLRAVGSVLLPADQRPSSPLRLLTLGRPTDRAGRVAAALGLVLGPLTGPVPGPFPGLEQIPVLQAAFRAAQAAEAWALRGAWIEANPGALGSDVEARFRFGATIDPEARQRAWAVINACKARFLDVLSSRDAWLALPASGGPGHRRDARPEVREAWRQGTLRVVVPASAFGLPSISIPTGASPPEGIALIGPPGSDHALLEAAAKVSASPLWPG